MISDLDFRDEDGKYPPLGEFNNKKAITRLEQEQTWQGIFSGLSAVTPSIALSTPVSLTSSELATSRIKTNKAVEKIYNLIIVMKTLLEEFGEGGIEIIPCVKVSREETSIDQLDLFVRVPEERVFFSICVRKIEKSKIVFNDEKETLMVRKKRRLTPWKPDPQTYIHQATTWIKKYKPAIFGKVNDKRRPTCKVLVLLGSTQIGKHREAHYDKLGDKTFLRLDNRSTLYIVHHKELISLMTNFIKEYGNISKQAAKTKQNQSETKKKPKSRKEHRLVRQSNS